MPRFEERRTWKLLENVPPNMFLLVREALSLRQKVVTVRQSLKFLQRCRSTDVIPEFIRNKKIGASCNLPDNHPSIVNIHRSILRVVIREKQHALYSCLLKCHSKEQACRRNLPDQTWRRIEGGSKLICDSIRSRAKSALCAKYDRLARSVRMHSLNEDSNPVVNDQYCDQRHRDFDSFRSDGEVTRATVIGDTQISLNALKVLDLGPSFSPSQNINAVVFRKVVGGLQRLKDMLRARSKRECGTRPLSHTTRALQLIPFPRTFYKDPGPSPEVDVKFRILSSGVLSVLSRYKRTRHQNLTCEQRQGLREIRELRSSGAIRISVSDKGGEFVVIPQSLDRGITKLHLQDSTTYKHASQHEFLSQCRQLNRVWTTVGKSAGLDKRFISRLRLEHPSCPVFYSLIKTHKIASHELSSMSADTYKIRPIISCVGGPTDRISWFLNIIISQLLPMVPSHLSNTNQFLNLLRNTRFSEGCVTESFDVTALYTNVQNDQALQALSEMLDRHCNDIDTFGLDKTHVMALVKECLGCNIFKWAGCYYSQIRGLAMGQRLAPALAVCFMSRIEKPVIERLPLMYCRYIDDCFIATSTQSEMDECFRIMNEQSQYIKLTRETPKDGWLPYLNTQVRVSNGVFSVKWYRKPSCKNILIHSTSAHPTCVKRAVIRNMFKTALGMCTGEQERNESRRLASSIAVANGYGEHHCHHISHAGRRNEQFRSKIPLCFPYISEKVSTAVQHCIVRAQLADDVMLVNVPAVNIKRQLVRNRLYDVQCISEKCVVCKYGKIGDCAKSGVVYKIECCACNATYIGETGRVLAVRVKEHLAGKQRADNRTPLGRHRAEYHKGEDYDIACKILECETEISARKALEAFWITAKNPAMNNRFECPSVTNEFMPFLPHCEL